MEMQDLVWPVTTIICFVVFISVFKKPLSCLISRPWRKLSAGKFEITADAPAEYSSDINDYEKEIAIISERLAFLEQDPLARFNSIYDALRQDEPESKEILEAINKGPYRWISISELAYRLNIKKEKALDLVSGNKVYEVSKTNSGIHAVRVVGSESID